MNLLTIKLGQYNGLSSQQQADMVKALNTLPAKLQATLTLDKEIEALAEEFSDKHQSLFLGRGDQYPIAMEGALKLKEISYIHAEAYASGELKHGPLALIDKEMPVIVVAPNNELLEKLKSNVEEVWARGGIMYVFADKNAHFESDEAIVYIYASHQRTSRGGNHRPYHLHHPTTATELLRGDYQRNRCRSAEELGEERYGGVEVKIPLLQL